MPFVQISMLEGTSAEYRKTLGDIVHQAMVETINIPPLDRFQTIREFSRENFLCTPEYLGIQYSEQFMIIHITLNEGRSLEMKQALYKTVAERVSAALGISPADIMIGLTEVKKENWSFGNGIAQYA
ncbi:tautomerase family protein [Megalodesulfovibrio gigas]|uniref:Putative tautomerase enzyme family protein n=1 Tax=Megalodesulfovibrio gigas (strain ATCC 19364 / DSM 1382 / NCIMB 9332 / VKM B-1759) TaxID=1121448 RepID=T2G8U3_MEGG1|nr:tautomerase family protein [Megalodesulfovibrio gigas]AGW13015.1 putative tautomerase enzyme family protein [Megalodesulfovibrio gigas DSM 1382 = ATCC 19364]